MNKAEALILLDSPSHHERLIAARFLIGKSTVDDQEKIQNAYYKESVIWTRKALLDALKSIDSDSVEYVDHLQTLENEDEIFTQAYAIAVERTTRLLIHEIEPRIGLIRIAAQAELENYSDSRVWKAISKLDGLLHAIGNLSLSASSPQWGEFDLPELIDQIIHQELQDKKIIIEDTGRRPLVIYSDPSLVELVICNGLKNAIEAMAEKGSTPEGRIVITWGDTDNDYWVSILDRGIGLPVGGSRVFDVGLTTKKNHFGMGLPIAQQAASSLGGEIKLLPRVNGGASFDFRWPIVTGDQE